MSLSANDLFLAARARLLADPANTWPPTAVDTPGTDINLIFRALGAVGEEIALEERRNYLRRFISTAGQISDEALDRAVNELTNGEVQRRDAVAAVATIRLTRANTYALVLETGRVVATATGITFRTLAPVSWSTGDASSKTVVVRCDTTGVVGNVDKETIVIAPVDVGDTTIMVTNPEVAAGGQDKETNEQLVVRARDYYPTARRGTKRAIEFGGLQTPGVVKATCKEKLGPIDDQNIQYYRAELTIADANGQANAAIANLCKTILEEYRGAGVPVRVIAAAHQYVVIRWQGLDAEPGYDLETLKAKLVEFHLARINNKAPAVRLERAELFADSKKVEGLIVNADSLARPAGDPEPNEGASLRLRREDVIFA